MAAVAYSCRNVAGVQDCQRGFRQPATDEPLYDGHMSLARSAQQEEARPRFAGRRPVLSSAARTAELLGGATLDDVTIEAPGALALRNLANRIARYAPHDGAFPLRVP